MLDAKMNRLAALVGCTLLLSTGCLRPAEEQADLDRTVGRAAIDGNTVVVDNGLAAVRAFNSGALELWAGAPQFTATIDVTEARDAPWTITAHNILSDAELWVDGTRLIAAERPVPTEGRWTVPLPPGSHRVELRAPDAETRGRWRFAILSDIQDALDRADDIITRIEAQPDVRFLISAGDLTEQGERGEMSSYQAAFRAMSIPYYGTPGNHERGAATRNWTDFFGRANYSFPFRGARFTFIDSSYGTVDPIVYDWLDGWLSDGRDAIHVVVTHIPIMDPVGARGGQFRSRREAAKLLVRLAAAEVDLNVFGHVHSYYNYSLAGIPTVISGGGGALPETLDGINRHFLVVEVEDGGALVGTQVVRVD